MASTLGSMKTVVVRVFKTQPIARGMLAYAVIWPSSNLIQQTILGRRFPDYDWKQAGRFCIFGGFVVAPILYCWIRLSSKMWPRSNFKTAIHKAIYEQFTYGPFAICCFLFGMSLFEGKTIHKAAEEVKTKFFPTWKVAFCFWPVVQTINFRYISEKNRVPYVSVASLGWTCFLAYMKQLDAKEIKEINNKSPQKSTAQTLSTTIGHQPQVI